MSDDATRLEKLVHLIARQRDLLDKLTTVADEIDTLLTPPVDAPGTIKRAMSTFDRLWQERHVPKEHWGEKGRGYQFAGAKDAAHVKRLLKTLGLGELERRMVIYLQSNEAFHVNQAHAFGIFVSQINAFTGAPRRVNGRVVGTATPQAGKYSTFFEDDVARSPGPVDAGLLQPKHSR